MICLYNISLVFTWFKSWNKINWFRKKKKLIDHFTGYDTELDLSKLSMWGPSAFPALKGRNLIRSEILSSWQLINTVKACNLRGNVGCGICIKSLDLSPPEGWTRSPYNEGLRINCKLFSQASGDLIVCSLQLYQSPAGDQ